MCRPGGAPGARTGKTGPPGVSRGVFWCAVRKAPSVPPFDPAELSLPREVYVGMKCRTCSWAGFKSVFSITAELIWSNEHEVATCNHRLRGKMKVT